MRTTILLLAVLLSPVACAEPGIVYLHRPWVHPDVTEEKRQEMLRRGADDARRAVASGRMYWFDSRPTLIDNSGGISDGVRAEVLARYGIREWWLTCPSPGFPMEYQQAYNKVVDAWLRQRYGPRFWQRIEREVKAAVRQERRRTPPRFRPDPPPQFFIC
ncbi:hypothetical protein [Pseudoduganella chitinolytica]|uniref:DUF4148 domain-containing protein n=1 Tax=Pseudoduganella chitinolytica TaxID=34070 RepID=A0ABY8BIW1_9BURK|nr:hypothetical protein [Pseudoduganella chitinolytica]WEF35840.1 hypothetical protein PX653_14155 [Pseudoduganella chitinolytica]